MPPEKASLEALRIHRRPPVERKPLRVIPVVLVLALLAVGWLWWGRQAGALPVRTAIVRAATASAANEPKILLNASGYVTARRQATVSSKVTGKVIEISVEEGMKVEEGQVLARLDASNVEASLHLAEAQLLSARQQLEETKPNLDFAQRELKRFENLSRTNVVSDSDFRKAEMEASVLSARIIRQTAEIAVAERQVAEWQQQLDDTVIRAPFPGVVTSKNAQPGEMISPMSVGGFTRTGICTIVDMGSLEIEVDVNESYIHRVQPDAPVESTLDAYADWHIPGKVIAIIPTADRQKATVKVRVGFAQLDPRILPDMGVKVAFQGAQTPGGQAARGLALLIPKSALREDADHDIVWVLQNGRPERRAVTVAQTGGDEATISAGLAAGEKVIVEPPANLTETTSVAETKS